MPRGPMATLCGTTHCEGPTSLTQGTHTHAHTHTCTHAQAHSCTDTHTHRHSGTHTHAHTYRHMRVHMHTHTHTHTHTHIHTHTRTHAHTHIHIFLVPPGSRPAALLQAPLSVTTNCQAIFIHLELFFFCLKHYIIHALNELLLKCHRI